MDTADACHERGIQTVAVTAGYIGTRGAARVLRQDGRRQRRPQGLHRRVLRQALRRAPAAGARHARLSQARDRRLVRDHHAAHSRARTTPTPRSRPSQQWIVRELGPDVPLHFTAFHPDYKMTDIAADAAGDAGRARARSRMARGPALRLHRQRARPRRAARRSAPAAASRVIVRDWYEILTYAVTPEGHCRHCDAQLPGRYDALKRPWGRKRVAVRIAA